MIDETKDKGLLETARLVSAVRGYQLERTRRKEEIVDFTVSPSESDDRILIRVIARHEGKARTQSRFGVHCTKHQRKKL